MYLISQCFDVFISFKIAMFLHITICLSLVSTKLPFHLLISVAIIPLLFQQQSQNRMSCLLSFSLIKEAITRVRIWQIFLVTSLSPFLHRFQPFSFLCVLGVLNKDAFLLRCSTELIPLGLSIYKGTYTASGQQAKHCGKRTENQWDFTRKGVKFLGFLCGIVMVPIVLQCVRPYKQNICFNWET